MIKYFQLLPKTNIDFIGMRKIFFALSGALMLACLGSVIFKGMNYGIDFTGGTVVQVQFGGDIGIGDIRKALGVRNIDADIQTFVGKNAFSINVRLGDTAFIGNARSANRVSGKACEIMELISTFSTGSLIDLPLISINTRF